MNPTIYRTAAPRGRWSRLMLAIAGLMLASALSAHAQPCVVGFFSVNILPSVPSCAFPLQLTWNFGPGPTVTADSPNLPAPGLYVFPVPGPGGALFLNWAQVTGINILAKPVPVNTWHPVPLSTQCCCCVQLMVSNVGGCWVITVDKAPCP